MKVLLRSQQRDLLRLKQRVEAFEQQLRDQVDIDTLGSEEQRRVCMVLVAPQGFEPRSSESESLVLPLNERAIQVVYVIRRLSATIG